MVLHERISTIIALSPSLGRKWCRKWFRDTFAFCRKKCAVALLAVAAANVAVAVGMLALGIESEWFEFGRILAKSVTQLVAALVASLMVMFQWSSFHRHVAMFAIANWWVMWLSTFVDVFKSLGAARGSYWCEVVWVATFATCIVTWITFCFVVVERIAALEKAGVLRVCPFLRRLLWAQLAAGVAYMLLLKGRHAGLVQRWNGNLIFLELQGCLFWLAILLCTSWCALALRAFFRIRLLAARPASDLVVRSLSATDAKNQRRQVAAWAIRQMLGVALAGSTTLAKFVISVWASSGTCLWPVMSCSVMAHSSSACTAGLYRHDPWWYGVQLISEIVDCLGNTVSALWIAGAFSGVLLQACSRKRNAAEAEAQWQLDRDARWHQKVCELATRGFTLEALLNFYRTLGSSCMHHWDPSRHTTEDVVRQAIIPHTASARCALATMLMEGVPSKPQKMVTHSWVNLFRDLVAAVCADALGDAEYGQIAELLGQDIGRVEAWLQQAGKLQATYWICAISVNQHCTICASNPYHSKDPVTGVVHPACDCGLPKMWNQSPPLIASGRSIPCEVNKFADMMRLLAVEDWKFEQVVAIDMDFSIFSRAWCVAELQAANDMGMKQRLRVHSATGLAVHEDQLRALDIVDMKASRQEDKDEILSGIPNVAAFNAELQRLIFKELLPSWKDLDAFGKTECVARWARWQQVPDALSCV